jgi:hypothetical protein
MVRQHVMRYGQSILAAVQTTSLYSFHHPGAWAAHLPVPPARPAPFPAPRQMELLERMALTWKVHPSLGRQVETTNIALGRPSGRPAAGAIQTPQSADNFSMLKVA